MKPILLPQCASSPFVTHIARFYSYIHVTENSTINISQQVGPAVVDRANVIKRKVSPWPQPPVLIVLGALHIWTRFKCPVHQSNPVRSYSSVKRRTIKENITCIYMRFKVIWECANTNSNCNPTLAHVHVFSGEYCRQLAQHLFLKAAGYVANAKKNKDHHPVTGDRSSWITNHPCSDESPRQYLSSRVVSDSGSSKNRKIRRGLTYFKRAAFAFSRSRILFCVWYICRPSPF